MATQSSGCKNKRIREEMAYETFVILTYKLKNNRAELIEDLIRNLEWLQEKTSGNLERIREIDKQLADLGRKIL